MDRRPRATPRAPSSRPLPVPSPNPGGATTPVATSSSSAGRPSTTTTTTGTAMGSKPPRSSESYHAFAQREEAARILQSYERLSWYSYARCESLAQTRLHFRNLVAGFGPDDEAAHIDYTEDLAPFLPSSKREEAVGLKASRKGKERASLSGVDGGGGGPGGSPARDGEGIATPSSAGKKKRRSEG